MSVTDVYYAIAATNSTLNGANGSATTEPPNTGPDLRVITIFRIIFYMLLMVLILGGNGLFITGYYVTKIGNRKGANYMYFLVHLAFADLLVGICLPYHMVTTVYPHLKEDTAVCLARYLTIIFPMTASVMILLLISVDRYLAFLIPLKYNAVMTRNKARWAVAGMWLFSFVFGIIGPIGFMDAEGGWRCTLTSRIRRPFFAYILLPLLIVIIAVLAYMYVHIFVIVWRAGIERERLSSAANLSNGNASQQRTKSLRSEWKVAQTGLIVLGTFYICWLPFYIALMVQIYTNRMHDRYMSRARNLCTFPAIANSAMNAFIYAWRMPRFRKMVADFLCRGKLERRQQPSTTSTSGNDRDEHTCGCHG